MRDTEEAHPDRDHDSLETCPARQSGDEEGKVMGFIGEKAGKGEGENERRQVREGSGERIEDGE
ncbi:hypothetical protein JW916_14745 [Candidatus Sumerlaeota bacterium]|nr:hypothetical protein [Candidatus Sumerlaeota bacterium]